MLPLALTAETLSDSLVLITLDWQSPWLFVQQLQTALEDLRHCIEDLEKQKTAAYAVAEGKEQGPSIWEAEAGLY